MAVCHICKFTSFYSFNLGLIAKNLAVFCHLYLQLLVDTKPNVACRNISHDSQLCFQIVLMGLTEVWIMLLYQNKCFFAT